MISKNIFFSAIICTVFFLSCGNKIKENTLFIGDFDLSSNDSLIIFSLNRNGVSSIYEGNFITGDYKVIVAGDETTSYFNPKYSKDDSKIVFIEWYNVNSINRTIYMSDKDGFDLKQISTGNEIIIDAFFSDFSDRIYYTKASYFGNYSPMAKEQPHDIDIYSIDINVDVEEKVSNLNAYNISGISEKDSISLFIGIDDADNTGVFELKKNIKTKVTPINNSIISSKVHYEPLYSKHFNYLAFTSIRDLYVMNLNDNKANLVIKPSPNQSILYYQFYNTQKKILFTYEGDLNFYSVNIDGSGLEKIEFKIK